MRYYQLTDDPSQSLIAVEGETAYDLTSADSDLSSFRALARLASDGGSLDSVATEHIDSADEVELESVVHNLAKPLVADEVWAAGVTYKISEEARNEESALPDVYMRVYDAERPELFFKASPERTVGPSDEVGIRGDSDWNVPEPELGIVLYDGDVIGYTLGNDMSSRSIEGSNPLYLPQAKVYDKCCSIGPSVASVDSINDPHDLEMELEIHRDGEQAFHGQTSTAKMVRTCEELTEYLLRHNHVPELTVLLTGTSLVPPDEFTLEPGDEISMSLEGIGTLENTVTRV